MISITTSLTFNDRVDDQLKKAAWQMVVTATNIVRNRAIVLVSKPAKRIRRVRTRSTSKGKKGSQYTEYAGSNPGQPPQVRTGHGRKNVAIEEHQAQLMTRLGVRKSAAYMAYLELGTSRIAARPWLVRALKETEGVLRTLRLP
ncbi:MAG: hypothetical protein H5U08_00680 [Thermogutta sp.]|uniref:hypothetical protein n=1 Tax=Thermogutta sp. TaxID=1962930 RepID=UPI0019B82463|nr:hypothetical protein [Thermogutta sp.]MBC7350850.1 hypothetical protein [Thermogutta sp.]